MASNSDSDSERVIRYPWDSKQLKALRPQLLESLPPQDMRVLLYTSAHLTKIQNDVLMKLEKQSRFAHNEQLWEDLDIGGWETFVDFRKAVLTLPKEYAKLQRELRKIPPPTEPHHHHHHDPSRGQGVMLDDLGDKLKEFEADLMKHLSPDTIKHVGRSIFIACRGNDDDWEISLEVFGTTHGMPIPPGLQTYLKLWTASMEPAQCTGLALFKMIHTYDKGEAHACTKILGLPEDIRLE